METKRQYEHPTETAGTLPPAVSPERALRVLMMRDGRVERETQR